MQIFHSRGVFIIIINLWLEYMNLAFSAYDFATCSNARSLYCLTWCTKAPHSSAQHESFLVASSRERKRAHYMREPHLFHQLAGAFLRSTPQPVEELVTQRLPDVRVDEGAQERPLV